MDPINAPARIAGTPQVSERQAGKRERDAFRQALDDAGGQAGSGDKEAERSLARELQSRRPNVRKHEQDEHHIDVVA